MRRHEVRLHCLALTLALTFTTMARAEPEPDTGRALPDTVRALMLARACDVPQDDTERPCAKDGDCALTRSNGDAFRAYVPTWLSAFALHWQVGATVFTPALELEGLIDKVENPSHWGSALSLLSGLPFQLDDAGQADLNQWPRVMLPNPALIRWVGRELLPAPETPMCGATAQTVYDQAFQPMVRQMASIYVELKKSGLLAKVTVDALEASFNTYTGRYAKRCAALAAREKDLNASQTVAYGCGWWLRRHAGPGKRATESSAALVALLGDVLRTYDGAWFKTVAKHFPKPAAAPVR